MKKFLLLIILLPLFSFPQPASRISRQDTLRAYLADTIYAKSRIRISSIARFDSMVSINNNLYVGDLNKIGQSTFIMTHFATGTEKLLISRSSDGITWTPISPSPLFTPTGYVVNKFSLRDPSIIYYNDRYYVAYTPNGFYSGKHVGILTSKDLVNWDSLTSVQFTSSSGKFTWAPEFFIDNGNVYLFASVGDSTSGGGANMRIKYSMASNSSLTTWTTADTISGTSLRGNMIDPFIVKNGSTYNLWYVYQDSFYVEYLSSSNLTSGYTITKSGDWAGWGNSVEGISLVKLDSIKWRIYLDNWQSGHVGNYQYRESSDNFATWTSATTIKTPIQYIQHGTIFRTNNIGNFRNTLNTGSSIFASRGNGNAYFWNGGGDTTGSIGIGTSLPDSQLTVRKGLHIMRGVKFDVPLTLSNIDTTGSTGLRSKYVPYAGATSAVNIGAQTFTTTGTANTGNLVATSTSISEITRNNSATNSAVTGLRIRATTSGTSTSGYGSFIAFFNKDADATDREMANIYVTALGGAKNTGRLAFYTTTGGVSGLRLNLDSAAFNLQSIPIQINGTTVVSTSRSGTFVGATITNKTTTDSISVAGLADLIGNSGRATIGAGDSVRVSVSGLTIASGSAAVAYKRTQTSSATADTIPTWDINTQGQLTIYGKYGWIVGYVIGKR